MERGPFEVRETPSVLLDPVREAILATMERFGQIRRTRGGVPLLAVEPEKTS
jgi:hypothetical protein